MQINRLKKSMLATLPEGKHPDGNGLYLYVTGGSRRWVLRFRFKTNRHELGLGPLRLVSLAEARRKSEDVREKIRHGINPIAEQVGKALAVKEQAAIAKGGHTFLGDIMEEAFKHHVAVNTLRTEDWVSYSLSIMNRKVLPLIGNIALTNITPENVADVVRPYWTKSTGGRVLTCIRACFNYAKLKGLFTGESPARWDGCLSLLLPKQMRVMKVEHRAACPWQEVPKLFYKISKGTAFPVRMLLACMLCVPRPSELCNLMTEDVDTKKRIITIRISKTSTEPWELPYPTQMDALLDTHGFYPFGRHIGYTWLLKTFRKFSDYDLHGFRSSFSSWCADHEKNFETREACLHHKVGNRVTAAYQRSDLLENRRKLLQEWADYVTSYSEP